MTHQEEPYTDPLIDEVRQRRRELLGECDNDLNKLLERIERRQKSRPEMMVDRRKQNVRSSEIS